MISALPGYVIIEPLDEENHSETGLVIQSNMKDRPIKGKVISVGEQTATEGPPVKVGDTIYYRKFGGEEIKEGVKTIRVVKFSECMAIYEDS